MYDEAVRHGALAKEEGIHDPRDPLYASATIRATGFMGHWLAGSYPVIEGWEELKLADSAVDALLAAGAVGAPSPREMLKRFRHGVFHYQRKWQDPRFAMVAGGQSGALLWAVQLERAFDEFFKETQRSKHANIQDWIFRASGSRAAST